MRNRALSIVAVAALVAAACAGPAATGTPGTSPTGGTSPSPADTSPPASPSGLTVGVVTDVGTVNDKNFNEYTFVGAKEGAAAIGAPEPKVLVPKDAADYPNQLKAMLGDGTDIIVTAGFALGNETTKAAKENPDTWFIGVDQGPPCVTPEGLPDPKFECKGDAATLLPKYIALSYQEDQAGFLAGMVAATLSKNGVIGAIGGITLCGPCIRYIQGYKLGAQSINPNIKVEVAWVTESDFVKAFNDPVLGKNFGKQFIQTKKPDVVFQVAGKTGNGVLDSVCEAGLIGIGVDVDQALSYPSAAKCIATSAEKKLALAVSENIKAIVAGTAKGGDDHWDAKRDGIGYSPFHEFESKVPADLKQKLEDAIAQMKAGTLKTCPDKCGDIKSI
ncbi:MAG TPA: BMP family ABC transporter substrate-binding protein [Candidatus Limnocylindrales bacterium]|nr:BMP family ABC transporter substrate-binding protein [Candidatus Limnocylindrales bacterium]